ncbi:MAG: hypothetical protein QM677_02100 [Microbacterium sp.]
MSWSDLGFDDLDPDEPDPLDEEPEPEPEPAKAPHEPKPAAAPKPAREPKPATPPREPKPAKPPREPKPPKPPKAPKPPKPPREPGSRPPILLLAIVAVLIVAVAATLAVALTRESDDTATSAETSTPTASAATSAAPSPTPTPSDTIGEPVTLAFSGTGFTLEDAAGREVLAFAWRDDVAEAVTALSAAFGAEPTQRVEAGDGSSYPDYTVYQWDGFALYDMVDGTGGASRTDYTQPTYVLFSSNEVGGIELVAEHEIAMGVTVDALRAQSPDVEIPRGNVGAIRFVFDQARTSGGTAPQYSMIVDTDGSIVTAILYYPYFG